MKIHKTKEQGFAHVAVVAVIAVCLVIGGVYVLVYRANQRAGIQANQQKSSNASKQGTLSADNQTLKGASAEASNTSGATSTTTLTKPPIPSSTSTKTTKTTNPTTTTTTQTNQPVTPLSALTDLVTSLQNGSSANVTASNVNVPAAVSGYVSARPLVFTANGTTYWAYTRVNPPDFNSSASTTANSFAIVVASGHPTLDSAHLDKSGNLVDSNLALVGYTPSNY